MLNIPVVLGSIRPTRMSIHPARLIVEKIKQAGHDSQLVDFLELPLPLLNSEKEPSDYNKVYPDPNVQKWSAIADAADGFVIVTPEYNHGYSPVIKNALDWLYPEFKHKAVGLVGVSNGAVGGARAIENLRPVLGGFYMYDIRETVMFANVESVFDSQGKLIDEAYIKKVDGLARGLIAASQALKTLREKK